MRSFCATVYITFKHIKPYIHIEFRVGTISIQKYFSIRFSIGLSKAEVHRWYRFSLRYPMLASHQCELASDA